IQANGSQPSYHISLLSGMPLAMLQATCAHEYTHAWLNENVSEERSRNLSPDAVEGFCEFIAYSLMDSLNEEIPKKRITSNAYTHGQIHLFIDARERWGFYEVVKWMKYGLADHLD